MWAVEAPPQLLWGPGPSAGLEPQHQLVGCDHVGAVWRAPGRAVDEVLDEQLSHSGRVRRVGAARLEVEVHGVGARGDGEARVEGVQRLTRGGERDVVGPDVEAGPAIFR